MFHRRHRRFPYGIVMFLGGFLIAALLFGSGGAAAGSAGVLGAVVLLPLLLLKLAFFLFLFGVLMRFVFAGKMGRYYGHPGYHGHGFGRQDRAGRTEEGEPDSEWQDLLRQARQEVEDLWPGGGRPRPWTSDSSPDDRDAEDDDPADAGPDGGEGRGRVQD